MNDKLILDDILQAEKIFNLLKKKEFIEKIKKATKLIIKTLKKNNKILFCGNGGSASHSQHLATEFLVRFKKDRKAYSALSLNSDTAVITAIGNDYEFSKIFSRQVEGIGNNKDLLFVISTSGKSKNILEAIKIAKKKKINIILLSSTKAKSLKNTVDVLIDIPSERIERIQEAQLLVGHIICGLVELELN
jgi:D-sedoheptulose 7-phosphate isomerase